MTAFPIGLFAQPDLRLRLWFNDGVNGFAVLNPAQRLTAAPYAMSAATAISAVSAASVSGPVNASQLTGAISSNAISPGSITADMLANHSVSADKLMTTPEWLLSRPILNPTPAMSEFFGHSVAGLGNDRIITGAYGDNIGTSGAGAAYLFSTSGALLTTFTNPTPMMGDEFGFVVAAMGSDRVLIGAHLDDFPVVDSGMAYLFSTNGTLLTTFTNPTCGRGSLWE